VLRLGSAVVVLGAAIAAHGPAAADPSCPPAAHVAGDAELGHAVVLELSILGVMSAEVPAGCPVAEVMVEPSGDGVAVTLRDGAGRQAAQVVTDAEVAASWIESWVHPEIGAPLLAARSAPGATAVVEPAADVTVASAAARPGRFAYRGLTLGAAAELTSASDGTDWRALSASVCARFGVLCAGLTGRATDNRGISMDGGQTEVNRYQIELLATLGVSLAIGRMTLVPSAGLGLAYEETGRGGGGTSCNDPDDPTGMMCEPPYAIDDGFTAYSVGPRAELGLTGAFAIAGPLSLTLGVAMSFAPTARTEAAEPDYAVEYFKAIANGTDPAMPPPDGSGLLFLPEESYQLPAEPSRMTRISLGLSWELE
jgi:hypothetical protein